MLSLGNLGALGRLGLTRYKGGGVARPDIYVDSAATPGGDGLSAATAYSTLAEVQVAALVVGDGVHIGFAYGSDFFETIDLALLNRVRVSCYGDSVDGMPRLRGDREIVETWTSTGTNLWEVEIPWAANGYPLLFDLSGVAMTFVAGVPANAGEFTLAEGAGTIDGTSPTTVTATIYSVADPNGAAYRHSTRPSPKFGTNGSTTGAVITGLWFSRYGSRNGVGAGDNTLFDRCLFDGFTTHSALPSSGEYRDCHDEHDINDSREGSIGLEFYRADGTGHHAVWTRCTFRGRQGAAQVYTALGGHTGDASPLYDTATVTDCSGQDGRISITSMAVQVTMVRPRTHRGLIGMASATVQSYITDPYTTGDGLSAISVGNCSPAPIVDGWRNYGDTETSGIASFSGGLILRRSVTVRTGNSFRSRGPWHTSGVLTEMTGCLFQGGFQRNATCSTLTLSNNNSFGGTSFSFEVGGTVRTSLATHQSATGQDADSVTITPNFVDAANGNFTPQASGLPANSGLERDPTCQLYTPIPASLAAAETRLLAA